MVEKGMVWEKMVWERFQFCLPAREIPAKLPGKLRICYFRSLILTKTSLKSVTLNQLRIAKNCF